MVRDDVMKKVRKHIYFYGEVQGVGFRYTARNTAERYGITGWVRNLDNGAVEMEAEGFEDDIRSIVDSLKSHTWGCVYDVDIETISLQGGYTFEIL